MRTYEEIVQEIKNYGLDGCIEDFFGYRRSDLMAHLPWEHAKQFIKEPAHPDHTAEKWEHLALTREAVLKVMHDYMPFAWDKANNFRGLSAMRSMEHYSVWTWLLGDDEKFPNLAEYTCYGKDMLVLICKEYGWDSSKWDDGVRKNSESE